MNALREVLADPLAYGENDAADMLELRRHRDRAGNALLADAMARSLRSALDRAVRPLAVAARRFVPERCWIPFGHARLEDHARERFGRTGRWVRDLAALGTALERLPGLGAALTGDDGRRPIGRVAALFIGKVASPESLADWIVLARSSTVRDLKEQVRRARKSGSTLPENAERGPGAPEGDARDEPIDSDDESDDRDRLRVPAPAPVRVAYHETAALHRAVSGSETSVTAFADALVAEACAGAHPPDVDVLAPVTRGATAEIERRLATRTNGWDRLDRADTHCPPLAAANACLERLAELSRRAGMGGPCDLDDQIRESIAVEDELEKALARLLLEMSDQGAWRELGFNGAGHYAEERLRLSRSSVADRVRLARALRRSCGLREAYEGGALTAEAARLVTRALGRGTVDVDLEARWIERAEQATVKRLRDEMRELRSRRLTATGPATREPLDDAAWHGSLRRAPGDFRQRVLALGRRAVVSPDADACLNLTLPEDLAGRFLAAVESSRAALAAAVESESSGDGRFHPEDSPSLAAARVFSRRRVPIPAWVGLLAMLEDFVDTWDDPRAAPKRRSDAIYIRDGWRCSAPACTSRRNLEDHHLEYRSRAGGDALGNRTCLCRFHHQWGEHGTLASCIGTAPLGIMWRLGLPRITRFRNELWIGGERVRESSRLTPAERAMLSGRGREEPVPPASAGPEWEEWEE
jgi:hypothetical protein